MNYCYLLIFVGIVVKGISVSPKCDLDSDYSDLGQCLRPWLDAWEVARVTDTDASNILFPVCITT